jgi:hypothetical protein
MQPSLGRASTGRSNRAFHCRHYRPHQPLFRDTRHVGAVWLHRPTFPPRLSVRDLMPDPHEYRRTAISNAPSAREGRLTRRRANRSSTSRSRCPRGPRACSSHINACVLSYGTWGVWGQDQNGRPARRYVLAQRAPAVMTSLDVQCGDRKSRDIVVCHADELIWAHARTTRIESLPPSNRQQCSLACRAG